MYKNKIVLEFQDSILKDEFIGWLSDGGGEDSFNQNEHIADFKYEGNEKIVIERPNSA